MEYIATYQGPDGTRRQVLVTADTWAKAFLRAPEAKYAAGIEGRLVGLVEKHTPDARAA